MTCGIKPQQICGTGKHLRRKLQSKFFLLIIFLISGYYSSSLTCILLLCVHRHGVRNSLLLAPMPTASTAQILGNNESIEPYTSNIYTRRVLSGEFQVSTECICGFVSPKSCGHRGNSTIICSPTDCESSPAEGPHRKRTVE